MLPAATFSRCTGTSANLRWQYGAAIAAARSLTDTSNEIIGHDRQQEIKRSPLVAESDHHRPLSRPSSASSGAAMPVSHARDPAT